jgi:hypothetical protein
MLSLVGILSLFKHCKTGIKRSAMTDISGFFLSGTVI